MLKRHILEELVSFLNLMPVVLVTGIRQSGKTTLVEDLAKNNGYQVFTFDNTQTLAHASRDPAGWLANLPKPVVIDEIQRVPEIFLSIKHEVDQKRLSGQYLLTGSANPLLLPRLGDSLAGRMGIVTLYPFSQGELRKVNESFIPRLFSKNFDDWSLEALDTSTLFSILLKGSFPTVQTFKNIQDVHRWMRSYLESMIERDVRDISNVEGLRQFPLLFRLLATRAGMLLNLSDISRSLGMVNVTLNRYIRLLETIYFVYLLPAWFSNRSKRITKSPKLYLADTAMLSQLLDVDEYRLNKDPTLVGQFLESFVFNELTKQKSWSSLACELYHFRDGDHEVDFVLERTDGTLVGIEVKSSRVVNSSDLRGLKHLKSIANDRMICGIVLHLGTKVEPLEGGFWGVPLQALWR